eukprot:SAG31_NODE_2867_length_4979_cov_2.330123_5_plen_105_part_00
MLRVLLAAAADRAVRGRQLSPPAPPPAVRRQAKYAKQAGAVGLVVVNNVPDGPLFAMTDDTDSPVANLPAVLVDQSTGRFLQVTAAAPPPQICPQTICHLPCCI